MNDLPLGDMSPEQFLNEYWQKKPLLIRGAFPDFESPLEPDELAGLACQEGVLSRLIREKGGEYPWQLTHGPLEEDVFQELGDSHWTVLVQEADRHVPQVADLFDRFTFLPDWRKDDVMISFAGKDAGVGAHIDSYDVFLLQGSGRRRWEIGPFLAEHEARYVPELDVRMLADFEPEQSWVLEPGDMLYLPPGVPHNGVALEPCLTYSFGFLAPTRAEVTAEYAAWSSVMTGAVRYQDLDLDQRPSGLMTQHDMRRLAELMRTLPDDPEQMALWFGEFITRPQRAPAEVAEFEGSREDFEADLEAFGCWRRHEGVRVTGWCGRQASLFADGQRWTETPLSAETIQLFTSGRVLTQAQIKNSSELLELCYHFTCRGWGYFPEED